jgi:hypothetical protein
MVVNKKQMLINRMATSLANAQWSNADRVKPTRRNLNRVFHPLTGRVIATHSISLGRTLTPSRRQVATA